MRKSIVLIVLGLFFTMNITGCSLFSSGDDEQENATVAEESADGSGGAAEGEFGAEGDFGDDDFASDGFEGGEDFDATAMAKDEGTEEVGDLTGQDVEVEDAFGDPYADDAYGAPAAAAGATAAAASDDFSEDYIDDNSFSSGETDDSLFVDEGGGLPADTMSSNQEADLFAQDMAPVVDTPVSDTSYEPYDSGFGSIGGGYDEPKNFVSVKKMKPAAYKRAGGNVNRLYVVRSGDNMDSIAEKVYGSSSKAETLYSYNSHFRGKTLNVGDKVYYESPNNPNDQSMMTYYEDNNVAPQYYTSVEGDNIRKVAKQLLGHERSWMEIYATNENVESKGNLPGGLQLRYWPEGSAGQAIAANDPMPEPEPVVEDIPEPEPVTEVAPPPAPTNEVAMDEPTLDEPSLDDPDPMDEPKDVAINDINEPGDEMTPPAPPAAGTITPPPPKPVAPPPPPAPNKFNKPQPPSIGGGGGMDDPMAAIGNDSTIMAALGGLLILAFIIMLIFIRRSRAKRVNFSQTQV